jgi:transient receptor potential cation channel subfamily A protein 1
MRRVGIWEWSLTVRVHGFKFIAGISTDRVVAIYISATIVVTLSLFRLVVLEGIQFITQRSRYLLDWVNWIEITLFFCSIIYVWVFHTGCLCPLTWQWQIGVVAVFLSWFDLIIFISKFPLTGIYVLMFVKILYTFLKMLILSVLLVFAFGLTFYLAFTQPEILVR